MNRSTNQTGKLTDEQKVFVVTRLACFDPPSAVHRALKDEFGVTVSTQAIDHYLPGTTQSKGLAEKWRTLFTATREAFCQDCAAHGIANKSYRLKMLHEMLQAAHTKKNYPLAASLIEQAAKEMGNAYSNRRELTGKDGKDLPASPVVVYGLPDNGRG